MTGAELLPATAWEQAAIIGIFIVFVGILLAWFGRQSDKWQKFMFDIDEKWRQFNKEQRDSNQQSVNCLDNSLTDLTSVTQALVSEVREMRADSMKFYDDFRSHDLQAKDILNKVESNGKSVRKQPNKDAA